MTKEYDFLAIGDTTLDSFWRLENNEARVVCSLNREDCQLCLNYADKIPVVQWKEALGGNSANAAVTAARMGVKTAIWTIMGDDLIAKRAKRFFHKEGISTEYFQVDDSVHSKVSTVIDYQGERTILIYGDHFSYSLPTFRKVNWVYLSSIGETTDGLYEKIGEWVLQNNIRLVYQPGTFQIRLGAKKVADMLRATYLIVMNKEEAAEYLNAAKAIPSGAAEIKDLLKGLLKLGPRIALITDGAKGAFACDGKKMYSQGTRKIKVVEKTGAGDAYASAFSVALLKGRGIEEAMVWGLLNSEAVIQQIGPQAGILTLEEIEKRSRTFKL